MRGDTTTSGGRQEATAPEKKRGKTKGSGARRGGQVEALLDRRQWHDKKLRRRRARGIMTASWGSQEA